MTQKKTTPRKSNVDQLRDLVAQLTPTEAIALRKDGIDLPLISEDPDLPANKWGYRCPSCNQVAFRFSGNVFADSNGNLHDRPNESIPMREYPIFWKRDEPINRDHPRCQHCNAAAVLQNGRIRNHYVVEVEHWEAARDKAMEQVKRKRQPQRAGDAVTVQLDPEGNTARLVDQPNPSGEFTSEVYHAKREEAIQVADTFNLYEKFVARR